MYSMLGSQGVVLATAMAVSGTVILLALRLQKTLPNSQFSPSRRALRSCISSDGKRAERKKKRVHFAEDVVDPSGDGEVFRRQHGGNLIRNSSSSSSSSSSIGFEKSGRKVREMPANRLALYNGMLRDRVVHRVAYSY